MKYFQEIDEKFFYRQPSYFNKYTNKEILKYSIGANLYMPGTQNNIIDKLLNQEWKEAGAVTFCLEDAISENDVPMAEQNILYILDHLYNTCFRNRNKMQGTILYKNLPLIFIRVRNTEQFRNFSKKLNYRHLKMLCGFNFPKFNSRNGAEYFEILRCILDSNKNETLYGMPILEDDQIIYKDQRYEELQKIQEILSQNSDLVLNIRVGGTDFSSRFGLRRNCTTTIYDIKVVCDCLTDIMNFFLRTGQSFVISGVVWEYFSYDDRSSENKTLIKETQLDIENGFQGKTIIHPSQIDIVNRQYIVSYSDYQDAISILRSDGGVSKGYLNNRMNEKAPHMNWAKKTVARANVFGVKENFVSESDFIKKKQRPKRKTRRYFNNKAEIYSENSNQRKSV